MIVVNVRSDVSAGKTTISGMLDINKSIQDTCDQVFEKYGK